MASLTFSFCSFFRRCLISDDYDKISAFWLVSLFQLLFSFLITFLSTFRIRLFCPVSSRMELSISKSALVFMPFQVCNRFIVTLFPKILILLRSSERNTYVSPAFSSSLYCWSCTVFPCLPDATPCYVYWTRLNCCSGIRSQPHSFCRFLDSYGIWRSMPTCRFDIFHFHVFHRDFSRASILYFFHQPSFVSLNSSPLFFSTFERSLICHTLLWLPRLMSKRWSVSKKVQWYVRERKQSWKICPH